MRKVLPVVAVAVLLSGCYHATVNTGRPMSAVRHSKWAHSWVYGLVPPSAVNALEYCPQEAATVETNLSLPNQLVGFLTGGIYTPMTITVTCAQN